MPKRRKNKNISNINSRVDTGLATKQDLKNTIDILNILNEFECEPGEVLDIILDETHPSYSTPDDIGKVRVRLLYTNRDAGYEESTWTSVLPLAKPLNANKKQYPLLHEIVQCYYYPTNAIGVNESNDDSLMVPDVLYYGNIINTSNSIIQNTLTDISLSYDFKNTNNYVTPSLNGLFGNTFIGNSIIKPLRFMEGDYILEGRSGNSIRWGSEEGKGLDPILLIRNKQSELINENDILCKEDINEDGSSIWFTSNSPSLLEFASTKWGQITQVGEWSGNQIVINSDRISINSKLENILFASKNSILLSSENEISIGSKYFTVDSEYVFIGKYDKCEPAVLGNKLISLLYELVGSIATLTVSNAAGVSTPPINAANFIKIMNKLTDLVSIKTFIE